MRPSEAVKNFLEQKKINHMHITCALSGGADSVCLLYCLLHFRKQYHLKISAMHIQHHLRGEESLRDENFCRTLCENLGVALQVIPVDVQAYQELHRLSTETAARECRYQAFAAHAEGLVATAHNASDNLETVIFRLIRGTGTKGLCGIPEQRDNYIRPLLKSSRKEIEAFLSEQHLAYITDSTNLDTAYTRNFIRHTVIPLFSKINPRSSEHAVSMMTDILTQEEDFLEQTAKAVFLQHYQNHTMQHLEALHPAMQRRCIRLFLEAGHIQPDYFMILKIQQLLSHGGKAEIIRGKLTARVSQHILFLEPLLPEIPELPLKLGENRIFPEYLVTAELVTKKNPDEFEKIHTLFANSALDYDIIKESAVLHSRKNGLHLRPAGKNHTVSVKKWLQTQPVSERKFLHYLSGTDGRLLWVQNLGVSETAAVTESTQNMLILHVHRTDTESTSDYHNSDVY